MGLIDLPTDVLALVMHRTVPIKQQLESRTVCHSFREVVRVALAQRECIATLHIGQLCVPAAHRSDVTLKQALAAYHTNAEVALQWLIPRCPGLIDVKLNASSPPARAQVGTTTYSSITDVTAQLLATHCPSLQFLALRCPMVSDCGVRALSRGCKGLLAVDLSRTGIGVTGLKELLRSCTELLHVNVSSTRIDDTAIAKAFSGIRAKLQSVDISDNHITDSGVKAVADSCPHLERANLSGGDTLETMPCGDGAVASLTKHCCYLRHIDVSYSELSPAGEAILVNWAAQCTKGSRTFLNQQYDE